MSSILASVPGLGQTVFAASAAASVVLTQMPPALTNLPVGAVIAGIVAGRDSKGQTLLQTDAGVVILKSAAPLPPGSAVILQIQSVGTQTQAVILSIAPPGSRATPAPTPPLPLLPGTAPGSPAPAPLPEAPAASVAASLTAPPILVGTVVGPSARAAVNRQPAESSGDAAPAARLVATPTGVASAQASIRLPAFAPQTSPAAPSTRPTGASNPVSISAPSAIAGSVTAQTARLATGNSLPAAGLPFPNNGKPPSASPSAGDAANVLATAPATAPAANKQPVASQSATFGIPNVQNPAPGAAATGGPAVFVTPAPETRTPVVPAPPFGHIAAPKDGASLDIPPPLPNGTQVHLRLSAHRAGPDDPAAPLLLPARQVAATVAAHTPAGQTILDTPHGRLALVLPSALGSPAVGDRMAIELVQIEPPPAISAEPVNALAAKNPAVVAEWETLRAILAALREINPELAQQVAARAVPQPGPELAHQLAAVLIAATGKAATLVGEAAVATLREAGRGALIDSLEKHGANLAKSPGPEASEWKILFLPLFERETFRQIRISTRNKRTDDKPDNRAGKRFVLETEFAGTGPIQIDGLLRASQLELIVRTHVEMPAGMQADIRAILVRNCGKSGIAGQISFQAMPVFPVSPFDEIGNSSVGCVV